MRNNSELIARLLKDYWNLLQDYWKINARLPQDNCKITATVCEWVSMRFCRILSPPSKLKTPRIDNITTPENVCQLYIYAEMFPWPCQ